MLVFDFLEATYTSPDDDADAVRVFEQAVTQPGVKFEIVFGVSDSTWQLYDLEHGRKVIGYHPKDKSRITPEDF